MSRIDDAFARLRADRRTGLVTYTTAGDPDLPRSRDVLLALAHAGADLLEVGVPFSDPLADGPVIQRATERALAAGSTLTRVLEVVADVRARVATPIVLFTYVNPLHRMTIAEVEHLVEPGQIPPDSVVTPGIFVRHLFQSSGYEKRIEKRTVLKSDGQA